MKRTLLIITSLLGLILLVCAALLWWRLGVASRNQELIAAVEVGDLRKVQRLLREGANPNSRKTRSNSSLIDFLRSFVSRYQGQSVLSIAVYSLINKEDRWPIVEEIISSGGTLEPELGLASLQGAAGDGAVSMVRLLLARGIPVDGTDFDGRTALVHAVLERKPEVVELLLQRGASLQKVLVTYTKTITSNGQHVRPIDFYSPASWNGAVIRCLIQHGMPLEIRLVPDRPLVVVATLAGDMATIDFLLQRGVDPNAKDGLGWSALYYAEIQSRNQIANRLRQAGAKKYW